MRSTELIVVMATVVFWTCLCSWLSAQQVPVEGEVTDSSPELLRTWTERGTQRSVQAQLVEVQGDIVVVQRPDGRRAKVQLDQLSEEDQQYIQEEMAARNRSELPEPSDDSAVREPDDSANAAEVQSADETFSSAVDVTAAPQTPPGEADELPSTRLTDDGGAVEPEPSAEDDGNQSDEESANPKESAAEDVASRIPSPGPTLHKSMTSQWLVHGRKWFQRLQSEAALVGLETWLERPRLDYLGLVWLGSLMLTVVLAFFLGRSLLAWFIMGTVLPVFAPLFVSLAGERGILPAKPRTGLIVIVRLATAVSGLAGLCLLAFIADGLRDRVQTWNWEVVRSVDDLYIAGLALIWALSTTLATFLAALLYRRTWLWCFAAILLPMVAPLLLCVCWSRRKRIPWVVVVTMRRRARIAQIQGLKRDGKIDSAASVVTRMAKVPRKKETFQTTEVNDLAVAETRKLLPPDMRTIALNFRGIQRPGGPLMMIVTPESPGGSQESSIDDKARDSNLVMGTCCESSTIAQIYWATRKLDEPFLRFGFKKQSSAVKALEKLPCIQRSKASGKLFCTKKIHFGFYETTGMAGEASVRSKFRYEAFIAGKNVDEELWKKAESHFRWLGGKRIDGLAPGESPRATKASPVPVPPQPRPRQPQPKPQPQSQPRPAPRRQSPNNPVPQAGGSAAEQSSSGAETKRCRYMFVLGGGFEPTGEEAKQLKRQFISSNSNIRFMLPVKLNTGSIEAWSEQNKSGIGAGVLAHVTAWGMTAGIEVNTDNVVFNDFYDSSNRPFAVAAYLN